AGPRVGASDAGYHLQFLLHQDERQLFVDPSPFDRQPGRPGACRAPRQATPRSNASAHHDGTVRWRTHHGRFLHPAALSSSGRAPMADDGMAGLRSIALATAGTLAVCILIAAGLATLVPAVGG